MLFVVQSPCANWHTSPSYDMLIAGTMQYVREPMPGCRHLLGEPTKIDVWRCANFSNAWMTTVVPSPNKQASEKRQ
jgi:hypothetical protein